MEEESCGLTFLQPSIEYARSRKDRDDKGSSLRNCNTKLICSPEDLGLLQKLSRRGRYRKETQINYRAKNNLEFRSVKLKRRLKTQERQLSQEKARRKLK